MLTLFRRRPRPLAVGALLLAAAWGWTAADSAAAVAQELGLDMDKFQECVSSRRYADEVQADLYWATNLGIRSTPTFFVNGRPIVGAQPFEFFKDVVEKELAGEFSK